MSGTQPVATYAMRIPPGDVMVPAVPEFAAMFRLTMAAIDPSEEPELDTAVDKQKPRATLKIVRIPDEALMDDSEDDEDYDDIDDDEEEDSDAEEVNAGPSTKKSKSKKEVKVKADVEADDDDDDEDMEDDSEDEAAAETILAKLMKVEKKGKSMALDGEEEHDSEDDEDESFEIDECVLCTLEPDRQYQQALDFVVAEGEKVFFKVSGNLTVHLTGNYVMPLDEPSDDEDEDDYDPEEDELDGLDALVDGDESDELDDLEDPRVREVDSDEEQAPKLVPAAKGKGKNKRPAEDEIDEEATLDNVMAKLFQKEKAAAPAQEQPKKLTKAEKKAAKKLKTNEGAAVAAPEQPKKDTAQTNGAAPDSDKKKVQFAKNLEQGPTPSAKDKDTKVDSKKDDKKDDSKKNDKKDDSKKSSVSLGVKDVQGVTVDDRKIGSGQAAKKGSRLEMRYIGKLESGKVFDSNKSGKPFSFKLGSGEVIKGWDVGLAGISPGGERRLTIPAHLAYGKKALPGIPANSKLIFDIKCVSVK